MKKRIVVSLAVDNSNDKRYLNASKKLKKSVLDHYNGDVKFYTKYPDGCPTHQEINYAFKPYVIDLARQHGYDQVLWIDAGCYVKKSLDTHWDIIEQQGYYLQLNGWTSGDWTTDRCLEIMGVSREEAFKMPHAMANVMGFDFTNSACTECFNKWLEYSKDKEVFSGPWKNDKGQCSKDSRVLGHRHDQAVMGIIASQMGLNFTDSVGKGLLSYGRDDKEGYVIIATGV